MSTVRTSQWTSLYMLGLNSEVHLQQVWQTDRHHSVEGALVIGFDT